MEDNKTFFTIIVNEDSVNIEANNWSIVDALHAMQGLRNLIDEQIAMDTAEVEGVL